MFSGLTLAFFSITRLQLLKMMVIEQDVIPVWSDEKRVITGADVPGFLLRGNSNPLTLFCLNQC